MSENTAVEKSQVNEKPNASNATASPFLFSEQRDQFCDLEKAVLAWEEPRTLPAVFQKQQEGDQEKNKKKEAQTPAVPPFITLLTAPDGAGKTTLLQELQRSAHREHFLISCHDNWSHPMQPLQQIISTLSKDCKRFHTIFKNYEWGLADILAPGKKDAGYTRDPLFVALSSAILDAAKFKPFVLIFDDLDRADPVVIEFIAMLGRSLQQSWISQHKTNSENRVSELPELIKTSPPRLCIIASLQDGRDANDVTQQALQSIQQEPFTAQIGLPPLNRKQFNAIAAEGPWQKLSPKTMQLLFDLTDRNTLKAVLLINLLSRKKPRLTGTALIEKAQELHENGIIKSYVKSLPAPSKRLLSLLSLIKRPVQETFLHHFSNLKIAAPETLLQDAKLEHTVLPDHDGFRIHPAVSVEAQQLLSPSTQSKWHDRIAEVIQEHAPFPPGEQEYACFQHAVRGAHPHNAIEHGYKAAAYLEHHFALHRSLLLLYNILGLLQQDESTRQQKVEIIKKIVSLEERLHRWESVKQNIKNLLNESSGITISENDRALFLLKLSRVYQKAERYSKALKTLSKAFSKKLTEPVIADLYREIALIRFKRGDAKKALNYCLRGLSHLKKADDLNIRVQLLSLLSRIYCFRRDYALAVDSLIKALDAFQQTDREPPLPILDQLGELYLEQGNYFRAARYLYRSLEQKRKQNNFAGLARSYTLLSDVYSRSGNFAKALEQQQKACEIREVLGDFKGMCRNLIDMGTTYRRLGHLGDSIQCLRRAVYIAEKSSHTRNLVAAFMSLSETNFQFGDIKQTEEILKQVQILSQEYGLTFFCAQSELLYGRLAIFHRTWEQGTKKLKKARDLYNNLGKPINAIETKIEQAELLYQREHYADAFKVAGQAQANAEEVRSAALQAKALLIKGNICRLYKAKMSVKWRECFQRALETARSVANVNLHFDILYSFGKAHHFNQSFEQAENWYRKAEDILERMAGNLSQEQATKFWMDKRRQLFREDYERLRRETGLRSSPAASGPPETNGKNSQRINLSIYNDLLAKINRLHSTVSHDNFSQMLLGLAMDIIKADRGFVVENPQSSWQYTAFRGLRPETLAGRMNYAETLVNETCRRKKIFITSAQEEEEKYGSRFNLSEFKDRSAMLIPVLNENSIAAVIYLDRPLQDDKQFQPEREAALELFTSHAAVALENRKTFLTATTWPNTPFLVEPYFAQVVQEAMVQQERSGQTFALLGLQLSFALRELDDKGAKNIQYILGKECPAGILGESLLVALIRDETTPKEMKAATDKLILRLRKYIPIKKHQLIKPEIPGLTPQDLFKDLKNRLNPSEDLVKEIQSLAGCELSLKEAKQLLEKHLIIKALRRASGNITHAAKELNIHRPQLSQLLRRHELKRETFNEAGNGNGTQPAAQQTPAP